MSSLLRDRLIDGPLTMTSDAPNPKNVAAGPHSQFERGDVTNALPPDSQPRLLDRVREALRTRHYNRRTEEAYIGWMRRFVMFHGKRHPRELGERHVTAFLSQLATDGVSVSTRNQALSALLLLYEIAVGQRPPWMNTVIRAYPPERLPIVLSREEVAAVLSRLRGPTWLMAALMYGAGLRLLECASLRVQDLNFDRRELTIRNGKGDQCRVTILPNTLSVPLRNHLGNVKAQHEADLATGRGSVTLPRGLRATYPDVAREWPWQWVFPATRSFVDGETGERRRHHLHETVLQRAIKDAALASGITRSATSHSLRHSFATHLLESGYDIQTIQKLLGHRHPRMTMIYTHMLNRASRGVRSPLDLLGVQTDSR